MIVREIIRGMGCPFYRFGVGGRAAGRVVGIFYYRRVRCRGKMCGGMLRMRGWIFWGLGRRVYCFCFFKSQYVTCIFCGFEREMLILVF